MTNNKLAPIVSELNRDKKMAEKIPGWKKQLRKLNSGEDAMTQMELSIALSVSTSTVWRMLNDPDYDPKESMVIAIGEVYDENRGE